MSFRGDDALSLSLRREHICSSPRNDGKDCSIGSEGVCLYSILSEAGIGNQPLKRRLNNEDGRRSTPARRLWTDSAEGIAAGTVGLRNNSPENAVVAQQVVRLTCNQQVVGSIPIGGSNNVIRMVAV